MIPRFESKFTVLPNGCWRWDRAKHRVGYGYFSLDLKQRYAHVVAWEWVHGPKPVGMELDHFLYPEACIGPSCVNPDHLRLTTPRENTLRSETNPTAINARRTECIHGHPLTGENLGWDRGKRRCKACNRIRINKARRDAGAKPRPYTTGRIVEDSFE